MRPKKRKRKNYRRKRQLPENFRVWDKMSKYFFYPARIDFENKLVFEKRGISYRKHLFKYIVFLRN